MEASQAGLGQGADAGGQGEGAGVGLDADAFAGLQQQVQQQGAQFAEGLEGLRGLLQQQIGGGEPEQQDDGLGEFDLSFLDPAQPGFDPEQMTGQLQSLIDQRATALAERAIQQHISPLAQRLDASERTAQIEQLVNEIPELAEDANARQIVGLAGQVVEAYGWSQEMANDPRMWRMLFYAGRAAEAHNEEEAQGNDPGAALLTPGRGATPPGVAQGTDLGELITGAGGRRGAGVLPF